MKLTIQHTDRSVKVNGITAPIWQGITELGTKVYFVLTGIAEAPINGAHPVIQLLDTVPMHGFGEAAHSPAQLLAMIAQAAPASEPVEAPAVAIGRSLGSKDSAPRKPQQRTAARPARRTGQAVTEQPAAPKPRAPRPKKQPIASLASKFKPVPANQPVVVAPAPLPAQPASAPAPEVRRPALALAERLPRPLPTQAPAPPPPAAPAVGGINPGLKMRLEKAVDVLAGRTRGRTDAHDKSQARQLLATHRDKLHLISGAAKVLETGDDTDNLSD